MLQIWSHSHIFVLILFLSICPSSGLGRRHYIFGLSVCLWVCTCVPKHSLFPLFLLSTSVFFWLVIVWLCVCFRIMAHTHTHTRLTALFPGLPGWAGIRKVKPIWILLKQETVSGSGISWAICKCASRSRQITMPGPTTQFFTGRMPFLPPNQQCQSTEGRVLSK